MYPEHISWFFGSISHLSVFWLSCFDSGFVWDPFRLIAGFLSLRFDLINMREDTDVWWDWNTHVIWKTGQPWSASLLKDLSCADFRGLFADVFEMFEGNYFKTFRGLITFTTCLAYIYFNFMCCTCYGLAPILFGIAVGSLHTIAYHFLRDHESMKHKGEKEKIPSKSPTSKHCSHVMCKSLWIFGEIATSLRSKKLLEPRLSFVEARL